MLTNGKGSAIIKFAAKKWRRWDWKISKENNIYLINLEVNAKNTIAINFYKKYNFNEVGFRKKYYDNTYDALLMTYKL